MTTTRILRTLLLGVLLLLATGAPARGEDAKPGLTTAGTVREALAKLGEGRDVELVLKNGKSYRGKLGSVGSATVLVTQLTGRDFYDALIDLDEVAAVELRVRGN